MFASASRTLLVLHLDLVAYATLIESYGESFTERGCSKLVVPQWISPDIEVLPLTKDHIVHGLEPISKPVRFLTQNELVTSAPVWLA
jgi:hypothetical protein